MATRIVIAEDNWLTPTVLRTELEAHGYEVVGVARTGLEALEMARREQPDVVLMDIRMPEMDGIEVTRVLMEECFACVVMVTGDASLSQVSEEAGAMGYLVKPFLPNEISAVIEMALQRFTRFQEVRAQMGRAPDALAAWRTVSQAVKEIGDRDRVRDEEAFARLRQAAIAQGATLHQTAEEMLAALAQRLS
jgi:response regulator NasT